jgi:hypothetical protein
MRTSVLVIGALIVASMFVVPSAHAQLSGAIFTTVADGGEVNFNIYPDKDAVYLDGGPGPGAPQEAAGLPDGVYVFMVTDPSGKTLLSIDIAACRRFQVTGGIITALVTTAPTCSAPHLTGVDVDHGAVTVQLMPYDDTPNNGGEYKAWATREADYLCPLTALDCFSGQGTRHGFVPADSKTDNFKVKVTPVIEIDSRFYDKRGKFIDGAGITWTDTLGSSNKKWSYYNPDLYVFHEAHVEAPEPGVHLITIQDQTLCTINQVYVEGQFVGTGAQTVKVKVSPNGKGKTYWVDVTCY